MIRRTIGSILGAVLVFGLAAGGCGGDDASSNNTAGNAGSGGYAPNTPASPTLELLVAKSQTLEFEQVTDIAVRYYDADTGEGISDAPITYAIVGDGVGSKLGALQATTNQGGEARVSLTAGNTNGSFTVEVTPPKGASVSVQIVISDQPLGSLDVTMTYLGVLPLENLTPQVHKGVACSGLDPNALPSPFKTADPLPDSIDDTVSWSGIDVAPDYAVTVTGQVGPSIRAFGCVDNVEVRQSQTTQVKVALADLDFPGPVLGTYELVNQLDFGDTLPGSVGNAIDLLDELTDDQDINCNLTTQDYGQDPGAFLTDFVMRQTCSWECLPGEDFDTCSQINHGLGDIGALCRENMMFWDGGQPAFFGGCGAWEGGAPWLQKQINAYIEANVPNGILAFSKMAGDLARAINKAKIYSELDVKAGSDTSQPMTHRLLQMEVLLHDKNGVQNVYLFDLDDVGLKSLQANATVTVDGTVVTIPKHEFELSYGKLVQYIYQKGLLPLFGYTSTTDMFSSWVDCMELAQWLVVNAAWVPMSVSGWNSFCEAGIQLAVTTFDSQLAGAIKNDGTLELEGTCTAKDINIVTNIASILDDGIWAGTWGEKSGGSGNVTGTFSGTLK